MHVLLLTNAMLYNKILKKKGKNIFLIISHDFPVWSSYYMMNVSP
jgi:hypothetical protein